MIFAPVPVGAVNTIVGADVQPALLSPAFETAEVITPLVATAVPVTTQFAPPPVEVNAVDAA